MTWKSQCCLDIVNLQIYLQIPYNYNQNLSNIFLVEIQKPILNFIWKFEETKIAKIALNSLEEQHKVAELKIY